MVSKALTDLYINHDEIVSVNNVLRECNSMKREIKNPENVVKQTTERQGKNILSVVRKILQRKLLVS